MTSLDDFQQIENYETNITKIVSIFVSLQSKIMEYLHLTELFFVFVILPTTKPVAEFKKFERRFKFNKFKPRLKYGWFHLKLYQMFEDLSQRLI